MKKVFLLVGISFLLSACTHNDGDIGKLFGKWQLKEIRSEKESQAYHTIFYNFQNAIVWLQYLESDHVVKTAHGYFLHQQDNLHLQMTDLSDTADIHLFALPDMTVTFGIKKLTKKEMILTWDEKEWILKKY